MIKLYFYKQYDIKKDLYEIEALRETAHCWIFDDTDNRWNKRGGRREFKESDYPQWRKYRTPAEAHEAFIKHARYLVKHHEEELEKWIGFLTVANAAALDLAAKKEKGSL